MKLFLSAAVLALFIFPTSPIEAGTKKNPQATTTNAAPGQTTGTAGAPTNQKRGNAAWAPTGPGCKMSGRC
jgi:hypothetical protein